MSAFEGTAPLLDVRDLTVRFGGVTAVDNLTFSVAKGSVHGLIGPNGAGKTTAFNVISGLANPESGSITLAGTRIDRLASHRRAALGLSRTFQNIRLFREMTVLENVVTGRHARTAWSFSGVVGRSRSFRSSEAETLREAMELIDLVGLAGASDALAGSLAYGDQRRLEIARAVASKPDILLLDEPAAALNPTETRSLANLLNALKARGITLLLVEHDMHFIMNLCDRITVLNFGRKIAEGTPLEVRGNRAVVEAYLGKKVALALDTSSA